MKRATRHTTQPDLFSTLSTDTQQQEPLTPTEQFKLDNPDFVEPAINERVIDPNARRVAQLRTVGGGLAAAANGELGDFTPVLAQNRPEIDPSHYLDEQTRATGIASLAVINKGLKR